MREKLQQFSCLEFVNTQLFLAEILLSSWSIHAVERVGIRCLVLQLMSVHTTSQVKYH